MVLGQYRWLAFSALGGIEWAHKDRSLMHHNVVLSVVPTTRLVNVSGFSAAKGCFAHLLLENPICFWESRRQPVWISLLQMLTIFCSTKLHCAWAKESCKVWYLRFVFEARFEGPSLFSDWNIELSLQLGQHNSLVSGAVLWDLHSVACFTRTVVIKIPLWHTKQKQILNRK